MLAGNGTDRGGLAAAAVELGLERDLRALGAVDATELEDLYAAAALVVTPSLLEGFGLPVLEAMGRGVAVVCSDLPVLREVAGDCALRFDPSDPAALAAALRSVLAGGTEVEARRAQGRERARGFSWEAAAGATAEVYELALSERASTRL